MTGKRATRGMSLRDRVLVAFAAIATVAIAIAAVVVVTTHSYLVAQLDARLTQFAGSAPFDPDMQRPDNLPSDPDGGLQPWGDRPSDVLRGFVNADGTLGVIFAPNVGDKQAVPVLTLDQLPEEGSATFSTESSSGGAGFRVYARATHRGWDITALPLDDVQATTQRLIAIEALGIALLLIGLSLVALWVIRLGVNPMRRAVWAVWIAMSASSTRLGSSCTVVSAMNTVRPRATITVSPNIRSSGLGSITLSTSRSTLV